MFNIHIRFSFKSSFSQKPIVKQDYLERGQLAKSFLTTCLVLLLMDKLIESNLHMCLSLTEM